MRKEESVCENLRPGMDCKKQIVLLGGYAHAQDTVDCPVDLRGIGTGQVLRRDRIMENDQQILTNPACRLLPALPYPLELILQHTGDVIAKVGPKRLQTVEEQHHKAVIACKWNENEEITHFIKIYFLIM